MPTLVDVVEATLRFPVVDRTVLDFCSTNACANSRKEKDFGDECLFANGRIAGEMGCGDE